MRRQQKQPQREFTYKTFRKKYHFTFKQRNELKRLGIITIFQGGYRGHSCRHHKKIRVFNFTKLKEYIKSLNPEPQEESAPDFDPITYSLKTKPVLIKQSHDISRREISRREFNAIAKTIRGEYSIVYKE